MLLLYLLPLSLFGAEKHDELKQKLIKLVITVDLKDMDQYDLEQVLEEAKSFKNVKSVEVKSLSHSMPITLTIVD